MTLSSARTDKIFYFESVEKTSEAKVNVHYHDWFEIYYLVSGVCHFFVDNRSYKLLPGDIVFIPQGVIHKTNYSSPTHSRMVINCPSELIPPSVTDYVMSQTHIFRNRKMTAEIDRIFKVIKQEYSADDAFSADALRSCLSYLFISTARLAEECDDIGSEATCVENAITFIQNNYMNKISLSDTAKYCSVSNEHLSRTFKKQTGVGYNEYLLVFRLTKAEQMLINQPGLSVSDIAYRCGFNDSNYFSILFKKNYGVSPSEKKKKSKK